MNTKYNSEIETLKHIPKIIENFVKYIPVEKLDFNRNETAWTIREHLDHIFEVQKMFLEKIKIIKKEKDPVIDFYIPEENQTNQKKEEIKTQLKQYKNYRKKQIKVLKTCTKKEFNRKVKHKEYTEYSIPILIRHIIFHEYWHMYRIEEILYLKEEYFK